jgi:hypothetical protein
MLQMTTKYKILWFVVDMHHRQRYFFICGCKQIVTLQGLRDRRSRSSGSGFCGSFAFPSAVCFKRFTLPPEPRLQRAVRQGEFHRYQSIIFWRSSLAIKEIS